MKLFDFIRRRKEAREEREAEREAAEAERAEAHLPGSRGAGRESHPQRHRDPCGHHGQPTSPGSPADHRSQLDHGVGIHRRPYRQNQGG